MTSIFLIQDNLTNMWNETFFEISNGMKFSIVHNMAVTGPVNSVEAAFENWLARTKKYTQQDFINYINSKGVYKAMTKQEYDDNPFLDLPSRSWRDELPTDKQKEVIENMQLALDQKVKIPKTKGECADLIDLFIRTIKDHGNFRKEWDNDWDIGDMQY